MELGKERIGMAMGWRGAVCVGLVVAVSGMVWGEDVEKRPARKLPPLPFTVSKETTGIVLPVHEDGTVDYVGALNERYGKGVKAEENGFVGWLGITGSEILHPTIREKVLLACGARELRGGPGTWQRDKRLSIANGEPGPVWEQFRDSTRTLWKVEQYPEVAAYLKERGELLDAALKIAERPRWWIPYVASAKPEMMSLVLPPLGSVRDVAEALCSRAMLRASRGDFEGFLADTIGAKRLARQVGGGATLIERLAGVAINGQVNKTLGAAVGAGIWNENQLCILQKAMAELRAVNAPSEAVDTTERWLMLDAVTYMAMQKSGTMGNGKPPRFDLVDQDSMHYDEVLKLANHHYDNILGAMKQPTVLDVQSELEAIGERVRAWNDEAHRDEAYCVKKAGESVEAYSQRIGKAIVGLIAPVIGRSEEFYRRTCAEERLLETLIAVARYKAKHGRGPTTLNELVPDFLSEVPRDAYSNGGKEPVKYVATEKGMRVYSVGPNGKDDGGSEDVDKGMDDIVVGLR